MKSYCFNYSISSSVYCITDIFRGFWSKSAVNGLSLAIALCLYCLWLTPPPLPVHPCRCASCLRYRTWSMPPWPLCLGAVWCGSVRMCSAQTWSSSTSWTACAASHWMRARTRPCVNTRVPRMRAMKPHPPCCRYINTYGYSASRHQGPFSFWFPFT